MNRVKKVVEAVAKGLGFSGKVLFLLQQPLQEC